MDAVRPIRFGQKPRPAAQKGRPATILAGSPETETQNYYTDPTGSFSAGIWESTPGTWQVHYTEAELCALLKGKIVLTGEDGGSETFSAGDAFVIPVGFKGTWETVEPCRKLYAVFEQLSAAPLKRGDSLSVKDPAADPAHR